MVLTDFLRTWLQTGTVGHTFDTPQKSRVAEGWAVAGLVALIVVLLWLAI